VEVTIIVGYKTTLGIGYGLGQNISGDAARISVSMQLSAVEDIRRSLSSKTAGSTSGPSTRESRMGDMQDRRRNEAFAPPGISAAGPRN